MQKECNDILEAKIAESNEKAKKLYRYVSDVARRVDEATAACRSIDDLFSTKNEILRQKIRENCEKLLFFDPTNYGKKTLELLWRKGYYDAVAASRKLQESNAASDNHLYTHIVCGIGHFHHIITRIKPNLKILPGELDYEPILEDGDSEEAAKSTLNDDDEQFARYVVYQCLIYLGDLSRYQVDLLHNFEPSTAARYYLQAAHIDTCSGMPFNQLGNLHLDKNYNLDSVSYYIQCLSCTTPFEGARDNLVKILEKQTQFCETLNDAETYTQTEHIQNMVANFLSLIEIWYFNKNDTNIPQRCNKIAHELKIAMDFVRAPFPDYEKEYDEYAQAVEEESVNPSYLNGNLVHKIVQICLFTVSKMVEIDEQKAFAAKAFTLALLSQLLQKLLKQLENLGFRNPAYKYRTQSVSIDGKELVKAEIQVSTDALNEKPATDENDNAKSLTPTETEINGEKVSSDDEIKKVQNGDGKVNAKKAVAKRRRRRRIASSDSSDLSDVDTESSEVTTDDACSDEDDDGVSDSTYKSDDDDDSRSEASICNGSDEEDTTGACNGDIEKSVKPITQNDNNAVNGIDHHTQSKKDSIDTVVGLKETEIQDFLLGDNFLPSMKLLLDWVLLEKELILSCGDSGEPLFQCVVDLLNILTFYFCKKSNDSINQCKILEYAKQIIKKLKLEYSKIPLPEDLSLRGTNICKFDKDAAEWQILKKYKPTVYEENVIRILNFIEFGNQIAKIVPRIRFNRSMKVFYLKKSATPKQNTKINHKRTKEWHNSKASHGESAEGGLLRRLGRLWLTSQVRELERSGRAAGPALLAVDAAALHSHLRRVKQLLRARTFVLLVPTVVLQELDDLKRERSGARDAIRWLEVQLRGGSRYLRAQRPGQARAVPLACPDKPAAALANFIHILEFCHHLTADEKGTHVGQGEPGRHSTPLLTLLVGEPLGQHKEFCAMAAHAAAVAVEYIGDFHAKWRQMHKSGKKR